MRRHVQKWGNSLAVRIPASIAEECGVGQGSPVDVQAEDGRIMLTPAGGRRQHDLKRLVARINRRNRPAPLDFGASQGREVW